MNIKSQLGTQYFAIRGLDVEGNEFWYSGRSGDKFITASADEAFVYTLDGARRKSTWLNTMTPIHGIRFVVQVGEAA